ncbi:MAG: hypothetical protein ABL982_25065 [Vicinamibacterales bacterium]
MTPKKKPLKDLTPKSTAVKGGKLAANDNITLVRAAKPVVKKDLPPKKDVKGGKKVV